MLKGAEDTTNVAEAGVSCGECEKSGHFGRDRRSTGGQAPSPAYCARREVSVETSDPVVYLNLVRCRQRLKSQRLSVCYPVECLHKDWTTTTVCKGRVPRSPAKGTASSAPSAKGSGAASMFRMQPGEVGVFRASPDCVRRVGDLSFWPSSAHHVVVRGPAE